MTRKIALVLEKKVAEKNMDRNSSMELQKDLKNAKKIDDFLSFMDKYFEKMKQVDTRSNILKSLFL